MAVTDLTGTKWRFNETIEYDRTFPIYSAPYNITYKAYYNNGVDYNIGTDLYMQEYIEAGSPLAFYGLLGTGLSNFSGVFFSSCIYESSVTIEMTPTSNVSTLDYIEFTGGTDVTNTTLIAWLEDNATQIIEEQDNIFIGTLPLNSAYIGTDEVKKIYVGESLVYEAEPSVELINFSIGGNLYQAEDGMTWAEWVASDYNTGGYAVFDVGISSGGALVGFQGQPVVPNEEIVANRVYTRASTNKAR